jgi:hypothetical protein
MRRGLSVALAELPNQARKIWPNFQIFRPIVLLLLLLEKANVSTEIRSILVRDAFRRY